MLIFLLFISLIGTGIVFMLYILMGILKLLQFFSKLGMSAKQKREQKHIE